MDARGFSTASVMLAPRPVRAREDPHAIEEAGGALSDVIRTRIFVTDRDNMMEVAKVHGIFFREIMLVSAKVVIVG